MKRKHEKQNINSHNTRGGTGQDRTGQDRTGQIRVCLVCLTAMIIKTIVFSILGLYKP